MEYFISDFAERTKANLETIKKISRGDYPELNNVYEVTQLINSFLGLVVLPNEKYKKWEKKKSTEMKATENQIWKLLEICEGENRYYNSFRDRQSKKIMSFIGHLRNAISHSGNLGIHFYPLEEGGDNSVTHILFYDSDYSILKKRKGQENSKKPSEFCLKLTITEISMLVNHISNLYRLVEKESGKNKGYEIAEKKMEELLHCKCTSKEGTIAEQLDSILTRI